MTTDLETLIEEYKEWRSENVGGTGDPMLAAGKLATEAPEVLDLYLKAADWPSHEVDELRLKREIGDAFVTIIGVCQETDLELVDCVEAAMEENASDEWTEARGL